MVGAAQDSVSSPLLFNVFLNDIILYITTSTLYNYFEENALYLDEENSNVEYFDIMHKYCYACIMIII